MSIAIRPQLAACLLVVCLLAWPRIGQGQAPPGADLAPNRGAVVEPYFPPGDPNPPFNDLVRGLRDLEQRLAALEATPAGPSAGPVPPAAATNGSLVPPYPDEIAANPLLRLDDDTPTPAWYERFRLRGYAQVRMNETVWTRPDGAPAQHVGDASVGRNQNFIIRRARIILQGHVTDRVAIYLQPDFASNVPGSPDNNQYTQIRDWYADLFFDDDRVWRIRAGQSKVPYGWENLQSSQNRLPLDRHDAFNSAVKNERDLGMFLYWTPEYAQEIFQFVLDEGLKGSGNYGVFGLGAYNGQGGSLREQNDNLHVVSRLTIPYRFANGQIIETGIQGYTGKYSVLSSPISPLGMGPAVRPTGTIEGGNPDGVLDNRLGATFVYYPQPWGFQTEWTVGRGPSLNEDQTAVVHRALYGGYVMTMYRYEIPDHGELWPFIRWSYFQGGYKSERNAPFSHINELELGLEWQVGKSCEFVAMYTMTDRTNTRALSAADELSYRQFRGDLLRFQLQVNY